MALNLLKKLITVNKPLYCDSANEIKLIFSLIGGILTGNVTFEYFNAGLAKNLTSFAGVSNMNLCSKVINNEMLTFVKH